MDNRKIIVQTKAEINVILESFSKPNILPRLSFIKVLRIVFERESNFAK